MVSFCVCSFSIQGRKSLHSSVVNAKVNSRTNLPPASDALPVAVQPAGEAAAAEMVHAGGRAGEEEGDPGHDGAGAAQARALLQLPAVEGPENRLQEVASRYSPVFSASCAASFHLLEADAELRVLLPPSRQSGNPDLCESYQFYNTIREEGWAAQHTEDDLDH